jgi:hypothetical protein
MHKAKHNVLERCGMKKVSEIKYPHSANLFQFCRRVLDHKFGGIRVIDQDVGQILGFDPADCSHWKKGKKNIRSIQAMKSIADHLGVDEKLVIDVACGEIGDSEAFYEYSGYGAFQIDAKIFEAAKKEFYRKNAGSWSREKENEFRGMFNTREELIDDVVKEIHTAIKFHEAPLYLPEIVTAYPKISLQTKESTEEASLSPVESKFVDDAFQITYENATEMRPYMRFRIGKAMGLFFLKTANIFEQQEQDEYSAHLMDIQTNLFAAKLIAPASLIVKEMGQVNVAKDVVSQLAEVFWISKTFMNRRLKEVLQVRPRI